MNVHRRREGRQQAEKRGRLAERLAAWSCRIRGYRVLAERYKTPLGEIDLVMRRGPLLVFAEVKARRTFEDAMHALRPRQQRRLAEAAAIFLRDHPIHAACGMRFDLIAVRPWHWPRRIADAWRMDHAWQRDGW